MPRVSELLDRFRPAAPPGPGSAAGVPAEPRVRIEAELVPVFDALDEVARQCARVRVQAADEARQRMARAAAQAEALVAAARGDAEAQRAGAAARLRAEADEELAYIAARARQEAGTVRAQAARRLPEMVEQIVRRVWTDIEAPVPGGSTVTERAG